MNARFLQIHFLTSYPAALLNRDDVGFAKRIPFGGATRTRISSQCLKRHWRTFSGEGSLREIPNAEMSIRSRQTFAKHVFDPLVTEGIQEAVAREVTDALMAEVLGQSAKAKKEKEKDGGTTVETNQVTVLGKPEMNFLLGEARTICGIVAAGKKVADAVKVHLTKERKKNLEQLKLGAGLDAALFGRMVTSDILARCDAAVHVAHAFTVHAEAAESDYFSAVDDLLRDSDETALGSGHIGTTELTSGLYYGYVVVDIPLLLSNLSADRSMAQQVVERIVRLVATVSPGAKVGSTAPHAYASLVLAECGRAQPRTLANSFLKPVSDRSDLLSNAYKALCEHLTGLDQMYGAVPRRFVALGPKDALQPALGPTHDVVTLADLAKWAATQIAEAS